MNMFEFCKKIREDCIHVCARLFLQIRTSGVKGLFPTVVSKHGTDRVGEDVLSALNLAKRVHFVWRPARKGGVV